LGKGHVTESQSGTEEETRSEPGPKKGGNVNKEGTRGHPQRGLDKGREGLGGQSKNEKWGGGVLLMHGGHGEAADAQGGKQRKCTEYQKPREGGPDEARAGGKGIG